MNWYSLETSPGCVTVHLLRCEDSTWHPRVVASNRLTAQFSGRTVRIEGKAPLWMYAFTAMVARQGGASGIDVIQPQQTEPVRVFPLPELQKQDPGWFRSHEDSAGGGIIEFQRHPDGGLWDPDSLGSLRDEESIWNSEILTLTGPAPNWLYAAVACLISERSGRIITYYSPRDGYAIRLNSALGQQVEVPPSPALLSGSGKEGSVIGVVGDPNSGKSVFSILLEKGFQSAGISSLWRLDCDYAAPTSHWYLQMIGQNRLAEAKDLREAQKREWTAEAERTYGAQLKHCARSLDWVIADFPGGIHKRQPVERIPPGREVLLGAADFFVILARADKPESVGGWLDALADHGLEDRVVAIVESADYQAPLDLQVASTSPLRAVVNGLDRKSLADPGLWEKLTPWGTFAKALCEKVEGSENK